MEPTDYQGNAKKQKEQKIEKPKAEKIISGEAVVQKRTLGRKIKDLISEADFRGTFRYVVSDVLIPAAKNMIIDGTQRGIERVMKVDSRRGGTSYSYGQRITYNNPSAASGYRSVIPPRQAPPLTTGSRTSRQYNEDIVISSHAEAERVLDMMNTIIDQYGFVSVGDLRDMCGLPSNHVDQNWGWAVLGGVKIQQIREGWIIDLPPAEAFTN